MRYLSLFLPFLLSSCAALYYPNVVNTPLFTGKGQASGLVSLQLQEQASLHVQGAYALSSNLAAQVNGAFLVGQSTASNEKHHFLEGALGYFASPIPEDPSLVVECFAGYGQGYTYSRRTWYTGSGHIEGRYHRWFVQPAIGFTGQVLDASFSLRTGYLQAYDVKLDSLSRPDWGRGFVEPVVTLRVGYRYLRFVFQTGLSLPMQAMEEDDAWQPIIFNIGFQAQIRPYVPKESSFINY